LEGAWSCVIWPRECISAGGIQYKHDQEQKQTRTRGGFRLAENSKNPMLCNVSKPTRDRGGRRLTGHTKNTNFKGTWRFLMRPSDCTSVGWGNQFSHDDYETMSARDRGITSLGGQVRDMNALCFVLWEIWYIWVIRHRVRTLTRCTNTETQVWV
jgi:hypothetical protein